MCIRDRYCTVDYIIFERLQYQKISTQWMPHLFRERKEKLLGFRFLDHYEKEGNAFLNKIVARDECWIPTRNKMEFIQGETFSFSTSKKGSKSFIC